MSNDPTPPPNTVVYSETASEPGCLSTIGNILWLLIVGWEMALAYVIAGIISCIFIITIPFGVQSFKLAGYALWPFGRVVVRRPDSDETVSLLANVVWFIVGGLWLAIAHIVLGIVLCITIIGIPFGIASFKMAGLALFPFGKTIVRRDRVPVGTVVVFAAPS